MDARVVAQLQFHDRREKLSKRHLRALQHQAHYLRLSLQPVASYEVFPNFDATPPPVTSPRPNLPTNSDYPNITAYETQAQFNLALDIGFKEYIAQYFASLTFNPTGITNLQELLNWTTSFKAEQYPPRSVDLWQDGLDSNLTLDSPEYLAAIAHNAFLGSNATIQGALDAYGLDALVLPTAYSVRPTVYAGYPVITVPLGYFNATTKVVPATFGALNTTAPGIPFGLSFIGPRFGEAKIIQYAYAFEQATQFRYKQLPMPQFTPTTQISTIQAEAPITCPDALGLPIS